MRFWILIALAIATPAQADAPRFEYTSPHVNLRYTFTTATGMPDGPVDSFEIFSPAGSVTGEIEELPDGSQRTSLLDGDSFAAATLTLSPANRLSVHEIVLELSDAGEIRFEYDDARQSMGPPSSTPPSCSALARSAVHEKLQQTFVTLNHDVDGHHPDVPPHLVEIAAAIGLTRGMPGLIAKCHDLQDPLAGGCYYDHVDFGSCTGCCQNAGSLGGLCTTLITCPSMSCRAARGVLCGGLRHLAIGGCIVHNCAGKPGDPSCTAPRPPCPGTCMAFCGPGHSSACGACSDGLDCCYP